jgi:RNA 3'-terminal phosphate cyclase (ATP)
MGGPDERSEGIFSYIRQGAPVGGYLANQLLLPMALDAGGTFVTSRPTEHFRTNAKVIGMFLGQRITSEPIDQHRWRVDVVGA